MVPISGRIEDDLYQWFVSLEYQDAKTNSDKLREALKELRRRYEASEDYVNAQAWLLGMTERMRQSLAVLERDEMVHSEVVAFLVDYIVAMAAVVLSARAGSKEEAIQIEEQLVRRAMAMTEALLRQALTPSAAAFDPEVVRRHSTRILELATIINHADKGEKHG
jgi:flagellar biosynthesis/type III secretory pathway protein FliH